MRATAATCAGEEMPNPTQIGSRVTMRSSRKGSAISSSRSPAPPVTPS
jgi:hypothetical protein